MKKLNQKTGPAQDLESTMRSLKQNQIEVFFTEIEIMYTDPAVCSNDKKFVAKLRKIGNARDVSKFNTNYNKNQTNSNCVKDTLKLKNKGSEDNSKKLITNESFNVEFPDDMQNFLISFCKCLELSDECSSACLIENKIYLTFNKIKATSTNSNDQMTSIKEFIELILNYKFDSVDDYKLLYNRLCKIKDHSLHRIHTKACGMKQQSLDRYTFLLKELKWIKMALTDSVFEDPVVKLALCNFAVCFNRVIKSSHLEKLKQGKWGIEIIGNGDDEKHAEIRLMRFLIKTFGTEKNKIRNVFIATTKRPCFYCDKILKEYPMSKLRLSFKTRTSSQIIYKNYKNYWPKFLKEFPENFPSFEVFGARYKEKEIPTLLNVSTSFKFEEVEKKADIEERMKRLEEDNIKLKKEVGKLKVAVRNLQKENTKLKVVIKLKVENTKLKVENTNLKKENKYLKSKI